MILTITIGILVAGAVYLILQRGMIRIILGMGLLSHATNLIILSASAGFPRGEPFGGHDPLASADPLPQAFVLTAIVISMATTAFMLALAVLGKSDDTRVITETDQTLETRARSK